MISDEQMIDAVREMDAFLIESMVKYQISPLSLSAMMLARLMRLTLDSENDKDFRQIMSEAITTTSHIQENRILQ